jgi:hypothetical protein
LIQGVNNKDDLKLSQQELDILSEYPSAFKQLFDGYSNMTMQIVYSEGKPSEELTDDQKQVYTVYRIGNEHIRFDREYYRQGKFTTVVSLSSSERYFGFTKSDEKDYVLASYGKAASEFPIQNRIASLEFIVAPFSFMGKPLTDILIDDIKNSTNSQTIFESVKEKKDNGEDIIEVTVYFTDFGNQDKMILTFYRNKCWAVKELFFPVYNTSRKKTGYHRVRCDYEGAYQHIPILKRYSVIEQNLNGETINSRYYYITKFIPERPDLSIFDPKQFLPSGVEVGDILQPSPLSWGRIVCIVVGTILIVFGVWMGLKQKKQP